jgi:methyltransferase-like protein
MLDILLRKLSIQLQQNGTLMKSPTASRVARLQAQAGNVVTNMRHEFSKISDLARHLLPHLDGTRDREALVGILVDLVRQKKLLVADAPEPQPQGHPTICRETAFDAAITELLGNQRTIGPQSVKGPEGSTAQLADAVNAAIEGLARQALLTG